MSTRDTGRNLQGRTVYSSDGEKLGKVDDVLMDDAGTPRYVQVKSGWFGMRRHTIPVTGFSSDRGNLITPYTKAQFESAPTFAEDDEIGDEDQRTIDRHYAVDVQGWSVEAMTRSEEELRIDTRRRRT
jgi:sporulation protein YlmC with PRC-barrel domain